MGKGRGEQPHRRRLLGHVYLFYSGYLDLFLRVCW